MPLSEQQVQRYARHILLPDVGGVGQERLLAAEVAVEVGPDRPPASVAALAYLAAAGVGTLRLCGDLASPLTAEEVRHGILYGAADVGASRTAVLSARLQALNPDVAVATRPPEAVAAARTQAYRLELDLPAQASLDSTELAVADALIAGGAASCRLIAIIARGPV